MASVELQGLRKAFGSVEVIHGVDLAVRDGEFVALVGPSGCGKSTLLRIIAGLEDATDGDVLIGDRIVTELTSRQRNVAMVFQNYALYPHMTVRDNMGFNLRLSGDSRAEIRRKVEDAARLLELTELLGRRPYQLSGGQRQRVAMGRAIVRDPAVFLFDEPLSNLDAKLRVQMRAEIKALHQKVRTTAIYVTHDQIEAMTLADRVVVLNNGRIEQAGSPLELYRNPANLFVAGFIGSPSMNFLDAEVIENGGDLLARLESGGALRLEPGARAQPRPARDPWPSPRAPRRAGRLRDRGNRRVRRADRGADPGHLPVRRWPRRRRPRRKLPRRSGRPAGRAHHSAVDPCLRPADGAEDRAPLERRSGRAGSPL